MAAGSCGLAARRPFRLNGAALPGVARLHSRRASQTNPGEMRQNINIQVGQI